MYAWNNSWSFHLNNFAVMTIAYTHTFDTMVITITTNNTCHLTCYWTDKEPLQHFTSRVVRGLTVPWGTYFCFVGWRAIEQLEAGDTLSHTFHIPDLVYCQTIFFTFRGTVAGVLSPSVAPIFKRHFVPWFTSALSAFKDTRISSVSKNANYGASTSARVTGSLPTGNRSHMFIAFDPSEIPPGANILSAVLRLAFFASTAEGYTHWAYRFHPPSWVELEMTYRRSSIGIPWSVGGLFTAADFVTSNPSGASTIIPPLTGTSACEWDVREIVENAVSHLTTVNIVITGQSPEAGPVFYDTREAFGAWDRPKLTIVYTEKP